MASANISQKDSRPSRYQIQELQKAMLSVRCDMPPAEHFFCPGVYGRRFSMKAGSLVVGKTHKHQHLMMVLSGRAEIVTEKGRSCVVAGHVSVSHPNAKRVVLALEDTTFMTVHHNPSDTEDLAQIEKDHIEDEEFKTEYHQDVRGLLS